MAEYRVGVKMLSVKDGSELKKKKKAQRAMVQCQYTTIRTIFDPCYFRGHYLQE
jgi:hypothetical protein